MPRPESSGVPGRIGMVFRPSGWTEACFPLKQGAEQGGRHCITHPEYQEGRVATRSSVGCLLLLRPVRLLLPPSRSRGDGRIQGDGRPSLAVRGDVVRFPRARARVRRRRCENQSSPFYPDRLLIRDHVPDRVCRDADRRWSFRRGTHRNGCRDARCAVRGIHILRLAERDQSVHHQRLLGVYGGHFRYASGQEDVRLHWDRGHARGAGWGMGHGRDQRDDRVGLPSRRAHADGSGLFRGGHRRDA